MGKFNAEFRITHSAHLKANACGGSLQKTLNAEKAPDLLDRGCVSRRRIIKPQRTQRSQRNKR
jgi:hypothetical protein